MRREPPVTLRGALKILGHHDRPWLDRINTALGGAILVAGVGAAASGALPVLAAGGVLAAVWGWVDQKNEATGLLRRCLDGISDRLSGTRGYERHQLIAAAHTTIVISAYFEVLCEQLGNSAFRDLALTGREQVTLASGDWRPPDEQIVARLYEAAVPAPSAALGFEENVAEVREYLTFLNDQVVDFRNLRLPVLTQSTAWPRGDDVAELAVNRYRSHFLVLAGTVPEFMIWANLSEHAATRAVVAGARKEFTAALGEHGRAMSRVESLLRLCAPHGAATGSPLETLRRANRSVLHAPVIDADTARLDSGITFPEIGRSYVDPRYRLTRYQTGVRPADESQWEGCPVRNDMDLLVAGHVVSPDATRLPLLLLGHPGAGKSLLTKVLAARLPSASFTVVRVPLRRVGANVPVYRQIQEALNLVTHDRVSWADLADRSADTVRVVLLDGLDELLQATANDRTGYLQEVMEFQRTEAVQDRPVIVVVTSRTVVADRVDIPTGTPIVRLEAFDDDQIRTWVGGWHEANAAQIRAGRIQGISVDTALELRHLAQQPVLLLMLALYLAGPEAPDLDSGLSEAGLLRQLLREFAVREARKQTPGRLVGDALDEKVDEQLRRLSVAALGMFNRGRQDISEEELGADLLGLAVPMPEGLRPDELGQRVLGEFFFLHTAEATVRTEEATGRTDAAPGRVRRRYEFLHATFGEYLVTAYVVDTLADMADAAFGGRRTRDPQDDLLFALLSHQPLAIQRPLSSFVAQLVGDLDERELDALTRTVEALTSRYRHRHGSDAFAGYRPSEPDQVRQLACYSANLVLLRIALPGDGFPVARLWPDEADPWPLWRSTVTLWRSGLDASGWRAMLGAVELSGDQVRAGAPVENQALDDYYYALLLRDGAFATRLRLGGAVRDNMIPTTEPEPEPWAKASVDAMLACGMAPLVLLPSPPPVNTPREDRILVTRVTCWLVRISVQQWTGDLLTLFAQWLVEHGEPSSTDPVALALLVGQHPALLYKIPVLADPATYLASDAALLVLRTHENPPAELDWLIRGLAMTCVPGSDTLSRTLQAASEALLSISLAPPPLADAYRRWADE